MKRSELDLLRKKSHRLGNKYIINAPVYSISEAIPVPDECKAKCVFVAKVTEDDVPENNPELFTDAVNEAIFIQNKALYALPKGTGNLQALLLYYYIIDRGFDPTLSESIINRLLNSDVKIDDLIFCIM